MQMCYKSYIGMSTAWLRRKTSTKDSRAHRFMAQEVASHWSDLAAYAKKRFNLCYENVISRTI